MPEQKKIVGSEPLGSGVFRAERVLSPDRITMYSNSVFIVVNQWDVQMNFGLTQEVAPGQFANVEKLVVVMTPEHALKLIEALKKTTDAYQAAQGPIRNIKQIEGPPTQKL